jgi:toxin ParE1/3/4
MMIKLRISVDARLDLVEIRLFSNEQFGKSVTDTYFRGFNEMFALLRSHPHIGQPEPDLGDGVRSLGHRSHRIYYRVADNIIEIARILHKARDAQRLLN